jgi:segregation and condensation protein A
VNEVAKSDADSLHLSLDGFEGPLDLLLELARRQRVDLTRISVPALVDQYLLAVSGAERADLIQRADWLVMVAWLTWLKSRLLLPTNPEEAREAAQAEQMLTRRLVELEEVRTVADWLNGQPQLGWDMFERGRVGMDKVVVPGADFVMLLEACLSIMRVAEKHPAQVYQPRGIVEWSPHQAMTRIQAILEKHPQGGDLLGFVPRLPDKLPNPIRSLRVAISSTLMAGLEMARSAQVHLRQEAPFAPIMIEAAPAGASNELEVNRTGEPAA